ncbi:LysR family transcriptional regulator [Novispirillum itersonii]|uniref:DNA-binding transcriptional LysR family regulator n=1 Tax=Novispirillum itersonii TaxID=189 RepID=A0A7W9ZCS6_NOVIT|nr:LysR family transcriptional regulator [Novispirillum itersonii]MBB6208858.1 DNA-binding transcriptional LysR family regulator [Novispirillum itersonii]
MDRLDLLRVFIAVADAASFAEAGRRLSLSPSRVTRAVAALEASLGVTLLHRTTRSVRLTGDGSLYLDRCRAILADLDEADAQVRGRLTTPRGQLVVTAPVMFGRLHILPVVETLLRTYPDLDIRLLLLDRVVRMVEEGVDIAIRIAPLPDSALRAVRLGAVQRLLVASPAYLAAAGTPDSPQDLAAHRLIASEGASGPARDWRFGGDTGHTLHITPRLSVNSLDAAITAAVHGLGIVRVLSYQVAAELADGRLVPVLPGTSPPPVPVSLVFQGGGRVSPAVRAFIETARQQFAAHPLPVPA